MAFGSTPRTLDQKREESRDSIKAAAMELFYTKGYKETTTRDIIKKAGILNGSLYNRFKNKEEILLSIISDAMSDFLSEAEKIFSADRDPMLAFAFPVTVELYLASASRRLAELMYCAHCSWAAVEEYVSIYGDWANRVLRPYNRDVVGTEDGRRKLIAVIGSVGNICGCYADGMKADYRNILSDMIKAVSAAVGIPVFDVNALVSKLADTVESGNLTVCGHRISRRGIAVKD